MHTSLKYIGDLCAFVFKKIRNFVILCYICVKNILISLFHL